MYSGKKVNGYSIGNCKKMIQKSVRFNSYIYDYIMGYYGNNFSDKLENLVISCMNADCEYKK